MIQELFNELSVSSPGRWRSDDFAQPRLDRAGTGRFHEQNQFILTHRAAPLTANEGERFFKISDEVTLASFENSVTLRLQTLFEPGNSARIFFIELSAGLQSPPVRRDLAFARNGGFLSGVSGNPGKYAGRDRTRN